VEESIDRQGNAVAGIGEEKSKVVGKMIEAKKRER
jgi:hypothetical protein